MREQHYAVLQEYEDQMVEKLEQEMRREDPRSVPEQPVFSGKREQGRIVVRRVRLAAACLALICFAGACGPSLRSIAGSWVDELLHLQVSVQDGTIENDMGETVLKKGKTVTFYSEMEVTERQYMEYLREHELKLREKGFNLPEGFQEVKDAAEYHYIWNEKEEKDFDDSKTMMELFYELGYGFCGADYPSPRKKDERILERMKKEWTRGGTTVTYYERICSWTKKEDYDNVERMEEIEIAGMPAYMIYEKDDVLEARIYNDGKEIHLAVRGTDIEEAEQIIRGLAKGLLQTG